MFKYLLAAACSVLSACGGSDTPYVLRSVTVPSDQYAVPAFAGNRNLGVLQYVNDTGRSIDVEISLSSIQTLDVAVRIRGAVRAATNLSVVKNGLLVGPPFSDYSTPWLLAGQSFTWINTETWGVTLAPGDTLESTSTTGFYGVSASGYARLTTVNLSHSITALN